MNPFASSQANIQVNQADHNASTLDNSTSQSETSLAVFGSTVVVGWNDSSQFATSGTSLTSMTGYGFSTDGGTTFTDAGLLAPAPGFINVGDPALAVDGAGNFYFASLTVNNIFTLGGSRIAVAQSTSTSPAVTFGTPVLIPGLLTTGSPFQDKELIAVDTSDGSFDGRVYVAWTEFASLFDSVPRLLFTRSTSTSPLAFATPIALSPADALNHGAMPAVGPNGEVYVVWGRFILSLSGITAESIRLLKSTDGGVTFSNPDPSDPAPNKTVASPTPAPDFMTSGGIIIRTRGFPYIAVDTTPIASPTRGNVYIVFQADPDGTGADRSDVFFTRSTDGGVTWSTPISINKAPAVTINPDTTTNDNWQPFVAVSPGNGDIAVAFYDRRNDTTAADGDPPNTKITLFKAVSRDAGLTWSNEQVSVVAFTPATGFDPLLVSSYMGDYNYAVADMSNFHLTWGDTRNTCTPPGGAPNPCSPLGRPDHDVFYAKEPIISDLSITKTDSPDPVLPGANLTYNLTVTNNGPSAATGVILTDTLPTGVTFGSATSSQGTCSSSGGIVTCNLSNLANGANAMVTIMVTANASTPCGLPLTNLAEVGSNMSDPNTSNNTASADTAVICSADLSITKTDAPDPVILGNDLTYTIQVTNNGPSDASGVMVTDTLPLNVTVSLLPPGCSGTSIIICSQGPLASGASATFVIKVTPQPIIVLPSGMGTITNTATVAGNEVDPNTASNTASEITTVVQLPEACDLTAANVILGTPGNDLLIGTPGDDVILGLGGNDRIFGRDGDDCLDGDGDRDHIFGGKGDDLIFGRGDKDVIVGGDGNDLILGGLDRDLIFGGRGDDVIFGETSPDRIFGNDGDDLIAGDGGPDRIDGGDGNDHIFGGENQDRLRGGSGNDILEGGIGLDRLEGNLGDDQLDGGPNRDELDGGGNTDICVNGEVVIHCELP